MLINNIKKLDPEGEFMSCFGSTDPVTGKHKERLTTPNTVLFKSPASRSDLSWVVLSWAKTECKPANPDDVDMDKLFIAQDSPAHGQFGGEPLCNGPWVKSHHYQWYHITDQIIQLTRINSKLFTFRTSAVNISKCWRVLFSKWPYFPNRPWRPEKFTVLMPNYLNVNWAESRKQTRVGYHRVKKFINENL